MTRRLSAAQRKFLLKVEEGSVFAACSYRDRSGTSTRFVGGYSTAKKAASLGLIIMPGVPELGRPSFALLTAAGRAALAEEQGK